MSSIAIPAGGAALFDLDGTLCDTFSLHVAAYDAMLAEIGSGRSLPWSVYRDRVLRDGRSPMQALIELGIELAPDAYERKARHFARLAAESLELRPGAGEVIDRLRRAGVHVAVVTGARRRSAEASLCAVWPEPPPELLVASEDVPRAKPAPDGFRLALDRLGVSPGFSVVFEDSPIGVASARSAGARAIAVSTAVFTREELAEADLVVEDWRQLELRAERDGLVLAPR